MFQVTFLGHQGWLFRGPGTAVLADPLLRAGFGHTGDHWDVWPPRQLQLDRFPAIDAVFLSHEHEDHFDIGSLQRLPRGVQVFAPARSSQAMFSVLRELGFDRVAAYRPGDHLVVGSLELFTLPSDATRPDTGDEWDVGPYLVRERSGAGSFFTNVDTQLTAQAETMLRRIEPTPGVWGYTNNSVTLAFTRAGRQVAEQPPLDTAGVAATILEQHRRRGRTWPLPAVSLLTGNGWCFSGPRQALNELAFHADNEVICQGLMQLLPEHRFLAGRPGLTVAMDDNRVLSVDDNTDFLCAAEVRDWPARGASAAVELMDDYLPVCGRVLPDESDEAALAAGLDELARDFSANGYLARVASMDPQSLAGRRPRLALVLLRSQDGQTTSHAYELDVDLGRFVSIDEPDVFASHAVGLECWASDLASVLSGTMTFTAVGYGGVREWAFSPPGVDVSPVRQLWLFDHPLRRPGVFLDRYRRRMARAEAASATRARGPQRPDLSIVIPFRNEGLEPERTVRSILETADPRRVEILALDDCSDDLRAAERLRRWPDVRYVRAAARQGADAGRDRGVLLARADNVLVIDAHMRFRPDDWLDKLLEALERHPRTVFCTTSVDIGWGKFDLDKIVLDDTPGLERRYGARLRLFGLTARDPRGELRPGGFRDVVDAEDIRDRSGLTRPLKGDQTYALSCVMGANYAMKRTWYQRLHGVQGIKTWGCTEPFLSLKSYRAGGSCGILTSVEIGHLYRDTVLNRFPLWHLHYNKLLVAELLLSREIVARMRAYVGHDPEVQRALQALAAQAPALRAEREYLESVFCRSADDVLAELGVADRPPEQLEPFSAQK